MTKTKRAARWCAGAALVALVVGIASFGSIERHVATRAIEALRAAGLQASIGSLDLDLRHRELHARDVAIGEPREPPFLTIRSLSLRVPWRALRGTIAIDEATLEGVRVTLRRSAGAASGKTASADAKLALPPIGRLSVRDASFAFVDPAGATTLEASSVSIDGGTQGAGLQLTLASSQPVRVRAGSRSLDVRLGATRLSLEKDDLRLDTILTAEGIDAHVTGSVRDALGEPRLELAAKGNADAGPLLDGLRGSVAFDATITGTATSPQIDATLASARLDAATRSATALRAQLRANSQRATLVSFEAATTGGRVSATGQFALGGGGASRLEVAWDGIDLGPDLRARVPALARWTGRARGRAQLAFAGLEIANATATGDATVEKGPIADGQVGIEARLELSADAVAWRLAVEDARVGGVQGFGDLSLARGLPPDRAGLSGTLTLRAADLASSGAMLAPGAGLEGLDGQADATLVLQGTSSAPAARVRVAATGLGLRGDARPRVTLNAELAVTGDRVEVVAIDASADGAQATGSGSARIDSGVLAGEIHGSLSDLARWVPESAGASGAADFDLTLAGTLREPLASGQLRSTTATLGGLPLAGFEAAFRLDRSQIAVESFTARPAAGGQATLAGKLARASGAASALTIRLQDADLTSLAEASLPAAKRLIVTGEVELRGPLDDLDALRSEGRLHRFDLDLARGNVRLEQDLAWRFGRDQIAVEKLSLLLGDARLTLDGRLDTDDRGRLEAHLSGPLRDVARLVPTADREAGERPTRRDALIRSLNGAAEAELVWTGSAARPRAVGTLSVRDGRALGYQATLDAAYADGTVTLGHLLVSDAQVRVEGNASFAASLLGDALPRRYREAVEGVAPLGKLHLLLTRSATGTRAAANEIGTATLDLQTDALDPARVRGQLSLENLDMNVEGERLAQQGKGRILIGDGRLVLEGLSWRGSNSDFNMTGEAQLARAGEPMMDATLALAAKGALDLRLLGGLGRGIEGGGAAIVDVTLAGSPRTPQLGGSVELRDGLVRYRPKRLSIDGLQGRIVLAEQKATIETLTGSLNGGSFDATGAIDLRTLPPPSGRVTAKTRGALLDWPRGTIAEFDSDLTLVIENAVPRLEGDVLLASSSYDGNPLQLYTSFEAWRALPAEASALDALELDVHLHSASDLRADTQFGRLDIGADLRLGGTVGTPTLEGRVEAGAGGTVLLGRRSYSLEHLTLDFSRSGGLIPFVRSRATTRIASHDVVADFTGPLDAPQTRLSSEPPLSENEIASLLTTGSVDRSGQSGEAMSLVTANLLGSVGRSVGFDTLRLEGKRDDDLLTEDRFSFDPTAVNSAADPESRLTITKRLSSELEVTLSQALASGGKRTTLVSWRPIRNVEGRATQRDDETFAFEARHDLKFGAGPKQAASPRPRASKTHERIDGVEIKSDGGPPVTELRQRLKLAEGDRFDYRSWLQDRDRLQQALAEAGFFDARIFGTREPRLGSETSDAPVTLHYDVRSGVPTGVRFEGFAASASLKRQLERSWWHSEFDSSIEEEAVALTRASLLDAGYPTPTIDARETQETDRKILLVEVDPGPRASRREVVFVGNQALPTDRLAALVKGKEAERRAFLLPRALANDVQVLLAGEGFLNATVKTETALVDAIATLRVSIVEGPRFTFGAVATAGVVRVAESDLLQASGLVSGASYSKVLIDDARSKLLSLYRSRGFLDATVSIDGRIRRRSGSVDATIHVSEGPRQVVAEVVIDGADRPAVREAISEGGVVAGKPVVVADWSEVRRRIYETGLVRQVDLEAEPVGDRTPEGDQPVRAHLTVENWPALRLRYGLQLAGTRDPLEEEGKQQFRLGGVAEVSRQTLFGYAISAGLAVQGRQGFQSARTYLTLPRTLGTPLRSSVFVTQERVDRGLSVLGEVATIRSDTTKLTFEERIKVFQLAGVALAYGLEWTRFRGEVPFFGTLDSRVRVARLTGSLVFDRRDSVIDATRGFFQSSGLEYGSPRLGSEFSFNKLLLQQYGFLGAPFGSVLATAVRWERASGADQALLTSGRLSAGGATTVRGYPEDLGGAVSLGGDPEAGVSSLIVFNQEFRFPLRGSLFGGAFFDHASRFQTGEGRILSRSSIGLGLRFRTSVGVLRLDYGYPLGQGKRGTFYFALGQAF